MIGGGGRRGGQRSRGEPKGIFGGALRGDSSGADHRFSEPGDIAEPSGGGRRGRLPRPGDDRQEVQADFPGMLAAAESLDGTSEDDRRRWKEDLHEGLQQGGVEQPHDDFAEEDEDEIDEDEDLAGYEDEDFFYGGRLGQDQTRFDNHEALAGEEMKIQAPVVAGSGREGESFGTGPPQEEQEPSEEIDEEEEEEAAALKIQAMYRGGRPRKEARRTQEQQKHKQQQQRLQDQEEEEEERAATKIQASFRKRQARKALPPQVATVSTEQAHVQQGDLPSEADEEQAASKIQAIYRGGQARKEARLRQRARPPSSESRAQESARRAPREQLAADRLERGGSKSSNAGIGRRSPVGAADEAQRGAPLERTMTTEEAAAAGADGSAPPASPGGTLTPRPPEGAPRGPRRLRYDLPRRRPPDESFVLSETELRRRAQMKLDKTTSRMVTQNIPSVSNYPRGFADLPALRLEDMPPSVQGTFIRVAKYEAEEWLKQEKQRFMQFKTQADRCKKHADKLAMWYEQKCKQEEEERIVEEQRAQEKEAREAQREAQRRKRNDILKQKIADWSIEKDRQEREKAELVQRRAEAEEERRRKREQDFRAKQKASLEHWRRDKEEKEAHALQEAEERRLREQEEEERRLRMEEERVARIKEAKAAKRRQRAAAVVAAAAARSGNLSRPGQAVAVG